jgi:TPP-dependent pyruvate/acetoin dehydrogenase alpha subunit
MCYSSRTSGPPKSELDAIDEDVKKEVEEAVKFAEESPMATAEELVQRCVFREGLSVRERLSNDLRRATAL